ncbi:hypothetical protein NDU88_004733 [Pleurodeles waltl]|uniref:Uncharacterized protein n=1 Tax=Pleurodeles waltl TaxID=8319 RepID=A0AAV7MAR3_PLEWA|nr:hypothetical protein NDU88_004733 [Pleurodeles waltl]
MLFWSLLFKQKQLLPLPLTCQILTRGMTTLSLRANVNVSLTTFKYGEQGYLIARVDQKRKNFIEDFSPVGS